MSSELRVCLGLWFAAWRRLRRLRRWLRAGYPDEAGRGYLPLVAILDHALTETEAAAAAARVTWMLPSGAVIDHHLISQAITFEVVRPARVAEVEQVALRLRQAGWRVAPSVAVRWPPAEPPGSQPVIAG